MAYADTANRTNPMAALGALGIPAGFGALLIIGLAVNGGIPIEDSPLRGFQVTPTQIDPPEPLPDPKPDAPTDQRVTQSPQPTTIPRPAPRPDTGFTFNNEATGPIGTLPGLDDGLGTDFGPVDFGVPEPTPTPTFDPINAAPRGNPGNWITNNDYRTSWINRGYSGVAGFALEIDRQGRITDCTITRSTGHEALDTATCRLLRRRAEFSPAKDASGMIVPGTYNSSVNWQIP